MHAPRTHNLLCITLLTSALCHCNTIKGMKKQQYVIGGWMPGTPETFINTWKPIFETHLTDSVGNLYDPPIDFKLIPVDYGASSSSAEMIGQGELDFIYTTPGNIACLETQFKFSPIATQRQIIMNKESGAIGSAIYSLASNYHIRNFSNFAGKKIGVGQVLGVGTFQLAYETLIQHNVHIFADAAQVVFYQSDYTRQMFDVLHGNIDVAFIYSGWLEANHPEELSNFYFHNVRQLEYQSEPFPFTTSTDVVPQFALSAAPNIPSVLRQQVMNALMELNASNPACQAAGISGFTLPASYSTARNLAEDMGVLVTKNTERRCHSQFESPYDLVTCPSMYVKDTRSSAFKMCYLKHIPCPNGLTCLCQPCIPDLPISLFPWHLVLGLCCGLFSVGLFISVCWRILLEVQYQAISSRQHHKLQQGFSKGADYESKTDSHWFERC